jgi:hypothetical protein
VAQNKSGPVLPGRFVENYFRCLGSRETVTPADGSDFQVQRSMFRMTAFIDDLEICLVAAADADQNVRFVVFTEVRAETALSRLNGFHVCSSYGSRWGR